MKFCSMLTILLLSSRSVADRAEALSVNSFLDVDWSREKSSCTRMGNDTKYDMLDGFRNIKYMVADSIVIVARSRDQPSEQTNSANIVRFLCARSGKLQPAAGKPDQAAKQ